MLVIGFHGPMRSGKDIGSQFVLEWAEEHDVFAVRRGFADLMKWSAARIFYPDIGLQEAVKWLNEFKFDGQIIALRRELEKHDEVPGGASEVIYEPETALTGRELLQRYGTECHREVFDDNFWVNQLLPRDELERIRAVMRHDDSKRYPAIVTITDVRFENEAQRIFLCRGEVWRVVRPDLPQTDAHISEKVLHPHLVTRVLNNNKGVAEYREQIRSICDELHEAGRFTYDRDLRGSDFG